MSNNTSSKGSIGFLGLLQIAFIVLKLCKVITWSWFAVLTPMIIVLILVFIVIYIIIT